MKITTRNATMVNATVSLAPRLPLPLESLDDFEATGLKVGASVGDGDAATGDADGAAPHCGVIVA
jgi:hypothetical protein